VVAGGAARGKGADRSGQSEQRLLRFECSRRGGENVLGCLDVDEGVGNIGYDWRFKGTAKRGFLASPRYRSLG